MYDYILPLLAREHRDRLLEEAKKSRMPKAMRPPSPRLRERLLMRLGELLITAGLKLRERYEPAVCGYPGTYQPGC